MKELTEEELKALSERAEKIKVRMKKFLKDIEQEAKEIYQEFEIFRMEALSVQKNEFNDD
jgi:transposase